jgi:hypothetical protein
VRDGELEAFVRDPDGNSVEAVIHEIPRQATIDHLWIRVRDLDESRRFYESLAPWTGFESRGLGRFGAGFAGREGSFSLIEDKPTEDVHVAFPASDNATVDAFHRAALEAGYLDNGLRAKGSSTTPATTALSYSTPTATTSRSSTTTGSYRRFLPSVLTTRRSATIATRLIIVPRMKRSSRRGIRTARA